MKKSIIANKNLLVFLLLFLFIILSISLSCFEYGDTIVLNEDLSGTIQVSYRVPLYYKNKKYKSYISRYPYSIEAIKKSFSDEGLVIKKIDREIKPGTLKSENISTETFSTDTKKLLQKIKYFGIVNIKISFANIRDLEKVIPGKIRVLHTYNRLKFSREIKGGRPAKAYTQAVKKRIYQLTKAFLSKQNLILKLQWPDIYKSGNNNCLKLEEDSCTWEISLKDTLSNFSKKNLFLNLLKIDN